MRQILIATHGKFASGIKDAVRIIAGDEKANKLTIVDAYVDDKDFTQEIKSFVAKIVPDNEYIIFTDLYGGSVNTLILKTLGEKKPENLFVISGLNLGLLLETVLSDDKPLGREGLQKIIDCAKGEISFSPKNEDKCFDEIKDSDFFDSK